ncbi:hypothetical protein N7488_007942 [Penicillium malachiteum]|nr:hypothetical protein N7488_007942 [Penicillium malachiteum]
MACQGLHPRPIWSVWAPHNDMLGLLQLLPPIRPFTLPAASRSIVETLLPGAKMPNNRKFSLRFTILAIYDVVT